MAGDLKPFGALASLRRLILAGCRSIVGSVDPLAGCRDLAELDLGRTRVSGSVVSLAACRYLQRLDLVGCDDVTDVEELAGKLPYCSVVPPSG